MTCWESDDETTPADAASQTRGDIAEETSDNTPGGTETNHLSELSKIATGKRKTTGVANLRRACQMARASTNNVPSAQLRVCSSDVHGTVACIFIKAPGSQPTETEQGPMRKMTKRAVPMWPQYEYPDFPDERWIMVNVHQQWYQDILRALSSSKKVQKNDAAVMDRFSTLLRESFVEARRGAANPEARTHISRLTFGFQRTFDIKVHGHVLRAVNSLRPFLIKVEDSTCEFLQGPFAAFVKLVLQETTEHVRPSADGKIIQAVSGFSFGDASCPNIRDKVVWCPGDCGWRITLRKPSKVLRAGTDLSGNSLRVDRHLPESKYIVAVADAYRRAIETWNEVDGSKRERIRARSAKPEDGRMFARWKSDDGV